ncbi:MAG: rRNA maturation RNase YbeY [Spirochaetota bacterium]
MKEVDLSSENVEPPDWLPDLSLIAERVYSVLNRNAWEIGVLICDESRITELNRTYRSTDAPTDVLTFSQHEDETVREDTGVPIAGDIAISLTTVESNAEAFGVSVTEEMLRVYVHALLHLAGFTHDGVDLSSHDAADHPMLSLQERLVAGIQKELNS